MPTGSIFVTGFDTIDNANKKSTALLYKYDKDFNILWQKRYGGAEYDKFNYIEYIGDNRLLVRGMSSSNIGR